MKKKWIIILLTAMLLLAACAKVADAPEAQSEQTPASEPTPAPEPELEVEPMPVSLGDMLNDARTFWAENRDLLERVAEEMREGEIAVFAGTATQKDDSWRGRSKIDRPSGDLKALVELSEKLQFSAQWEGSCFVIALPENRDATHAKYEIRLIYAETAQPADETLAENWYLLFEGFSDVGSGRTLYDIWKTEDGDFIELFPVGKARYVMRGEGTSDWLFEAFTVSWNDITFRDSRWLSGAVYDWDSDTMLFFYPDGGQHRAARAEGYHPFWNDTGVEYQTFPLISREETKAKVIAFLEETKDELERAAADGDLTAIKKIAEDWGITVKVAKHGPQPEFSTDAEPFIELQIGSTMIDVSDLGDVYPGLLYWVSLIYTANAEDQIENDYYRYVMEPIAENWYLEIWDNAF